MADTNVKITVLDHLDDIKVPGLPFEKPANEYWALICLWNGLEILYSNARRTDQIVNSELRSKSETSTFIYGNHPAFEKISMPLLTCVFHWYAVSACQYARTVGAIAFRNDDSRPRPPKYVELVMPEVLAFRDKVAAHFAWTSRHSKDNDAERAFSVMPPLSFIHDSFHVAAFALNVRQGDKTSTSKTIAPWSIREVHEKLRQRYWPNQSDGSIEVANAE